MSRMCRGITALFYVECVGNYSITLYTLCRGITALFCVHCVGEHCELEERDGHHVLQCAWARVKRVLTDYDFSHVPQKEQVLLL